MVQNPDSVCSESVPFNWFEKVFQELTDRAVVFVDQDLCLLYVRGRAEQYLNAPQAEMPLRECIPMGLLLLIQSYLEQLSPEAPRLQIDALPWVRGSQKLRVDLELRLIQDAQRNREIYWLKFEPASGEKPGQMAEQKAVNAENLQNQQILLLEQELQKAERSFQDNKIRELTDLNDEMAELYDATGVAAIFLDSEFRVRRFTPAVTEIFSITQDDLGCSIQSLHHELDSDDIMDDIQRAFQSGVSREREISPKKQIPYRLKIQPLKSRKHHIQGVVLTFADSMCKAADMKPTQNLYFEAFRQASVPMALINSAGEIDQVNRALCDFVGYSEEALKAMTFRDISHPDDLEHVVGYLECLLAGEINTYQIEKRYIHQNQAILWGLLTVSAIRNDSGGLLYIIGQIQDVSRAKQAAEIIELERHRLNKAEELAHLGSWEMDFITGDTMWSDEFYRICGLEPDMMESSSELRLSLIHPEDRSRAQNALDKALEIGRDYAIDIRIVRPNGEVRYVYSQGSIQYNEAGAADKLMGVVLDLTDLRLAEAKLRVYAQQLESQNRDLQEFSYIASHDLQEPLRKIQAFGGRLEDKYADVLGDKGRDYLKRMQSAAQRMQKMIQDLLAYSRVTNSPRVLKPVSLEEVLASTCEILFLQIEVTKAKIESQPLPEVDGDLLQLRQLFQNLISNSLKYRDLSRTPEIQICAQVDDSDVMLNFSDNGIGFEEIYAEQIFLPFQRLFSYEEYPGSGIGLAICQKIVDSHGGKIAVHSQPGKGANFEVRLPLRQVKSPN